MLSANPTLGKVNTGNKGGKNIIRQHQSIARKWNSLSRNISCYDPLSALLMKRYKTNKEKK